MEGITKRFDGVLANDGVDFEAHPGQIHGLLGENGAGKTTLMSILSGLYESDEGEIFVDGRRVAIRSPRDAMALGIGMVHQHFTLVAPLTVAENLALGQRRQRHRGPLLNLRAAEQEIRRLSREYGLEVDPRRRAEDLPVGQQQRAEIVKALYRGSRVLILDEPTAVLTPAEARQLFATLRRMAQAGHAIVFISHHLDEVMAITDCVTVLRDGRVVGTRVTRQATERELARLMVGREVFLHVEKPPAQPGETVLRLENVWMEDKGHQGLRGLSLEVRRGEILGIAGVDGNGQTELAEVVTGLRQPQRGEVVIRGLRVDRVTPRRISALGVAHIPADRVRAGLISGFSVAENLVLDCYYAPPQVRGLFLDHRAIYGQAVSLIQEYAIRGAGPRALVRTLSGGNQQKVVLARALRRDPDLLVAVLPTRGLDIAATEFIHTELLKLRAKGAAILLISTDLSEVLALSDRIGVLFAGQIVGTGEPETVGAETVGLMMAGVSGAE
jgi:ABC-type uncharacterized transport system ATPase subunit